MLMLTRFSILLLALNSCGLLTALGADGICSLSLQGNFHIAVSEPAVGHVLILTKAEYTELALTDRLSPTDFVVVDEFPFDIPPQVVAGVVSGTPIPPGSHIEIFAEKLKIPLVYEPGATTRPEWQRLATHDGLSRIEFDPESGNAKIQENLSPIELKAFRSERKIKLPGVAIDRAFSALQSKHEMDGNVSRFGQKAGNLSRAYLLSEEDDESFPDFSALPFGAYFRYLDETRVGKNTFADAIAEKMQAIESGSLSQASVSSELATIRGWFDTIEIPDALLDSIYESLVKIYGPLNGAFRFRGSFILENWIGAGIFDSFTLPTASASDRRREISRVIRDVWKSLYTFRAYQVRSLFGIDDSLAALGILIHPSIEDHVASGVTRSWDFFGDYYTKTTLYAKGDSATSPITDARYDHVWWLKKTSRKQLFSIDGIDYQPISQWAGKPETAQSIERVAHVTSDIQFKWTHQIVTDQPVALGFEWVLKTEYDAKDDSYYFVPVILEVKESLLSPYPESDLEGSNKLPPKVVDRLKSAPRSADRVDIDSLLGKSFYRPIDFFLKNFDPDKVKGAYYFIEVDGTPILLLSQKEHEFGRDFLVSAFDKLKIKMRIILMGRLSAKFDHEEDRLTLAEVSLNESDKAVRSPESRFPKRHLPAFQELIRQLLKPGYIDTTPETKLIESGIDDGFLEVMGSGKVFLEEFLSRPEL